VNDGPGLRHAGQGRPPTGLLQSGVRRRRRRQHRQRLVLDPEGRKAPLDKEVLPL